MFILRVRRIMLPAALMVQVILFAWGASAEQAAEQTLIHAGRLIDVAGSRVLEEQTIIIEGDRVVAVPR